MPEVSRDTGFDGQKRFRELQEEIRDKVENEGLLLGLVLNAFLTAQGVAVYLEGSTAPTVYILSKDAARKAVLDFAAWKLDNPLQEES